MKLFNTTILASSLAAALLSTASAVDYVYITGSTAFRAATQTALLKIMGSTNGTSLPAGSTFAYVGASYTGTSRATLHGFVNGNEVIVKTAWSGSTGGIQAVSNNITLQFLPDSTTQSSAGTSGASFTVDAAGNDYHIADIAMGDTYQSATPFNTNLLTDTPVGVQPFVWVASNGSPTGLNNLNPQQAQVLFSNGSYPLSFFTGLNADEGVKVFATGRDPDSGTRLTAFAESGVGALSQVVQYEPVISGSTVTSHAPWHPITVNGIPVAQGDGGYSSGGTLANTMKLTTAAINGYYVSYLSTGDAVGAINGGAKLLSWNGHSLAFTGAPGSGTFSDLTPIKEGKYTFWCLEHVLYRTTITAPQKDVADTMANQILTVDAPIRLDQMLVTRTADGGNVYPK
jgi:hypothetical protein